MTKLITFDITNTIIRVMGSVGQQYANVAGIYGLKADACNLDQSFKSAWKKQNAQYPNFGCQQGLSSYKWWTDLVKNCFTEAGHSGNDKLLTIANHLYVHFSTCKGWEIFPTSVCATLDEIKRKYPTMKYGVISNFDDRLDKILQSLAIRHYFDFVLPSGLAKVAKPDKKIFHLALDIASVQPSEAIHVGDNVTNDYFGAQGVGMTALLLCHVGQSVSKEVDENYVIHNLSGILNHIK
ncbi:hypothetical protein CHS0354_017827 [Potamilus streckersoni]|uniref:Haloacid dehalogenase-like hydrolase domain-containing protein 3 n=1 Tax=Potamilus streckersoni TaxID=2493646 RepID=A0AAE0T950_9BIVA|nr:hypothetical protein CHS0354_017827 [Potamilus streckersoni]